MQTISFERSDNLIKMPSQLWKIAEDSKSHAVKIAMAQSVNPMKYFCPNGAQEEYINVVGKSANDSQIPVIMPTFANGVGKTTATAHIVMNLVYGPQNGWFDLPLFNDFTFPKVVWYCSTADALKQTIIPEFEKLVEPDSMVESKEGKPYTSRMVFNNGWVIHFKTYDQDPSTYESANVGVVCADEPMPEHLWKAVKSRRRMGAVTLLPMTPLYTPPYILDEIQQASDDGVAGYHHLKASVYDACRDRGKRGHLKSDIVDQMVEGYDAEEREARAFGEFAYFSGRIYDELDRNIHFVNPEDYPIQSGSRIFQVVDPHDSRFSAVIWASISPKGRVTIFDEYPNDTSRPYWEFSKGKTIEEEVEGWINVEKKYPYKEYTRIMDRIFGWQTRGQRFLFELYMNESGKQGKHMAFTKSYQSSAKEGEVQFGHKSVRQLIKPMDDGKPGLVIHNNCYHTWNGLIHYIRKHETTKASTDRGAGMGKIVEKYKDFPDVVRFLACSGLRPIEKKNIYSKKIADFKKFKKRDPDTEQSNRNSRSWLQS